MTQAPEIAPTQSVGSNYALSGVFNARKPHHTIRTYKVLVTPRHHSVSL
jgi:hypothetical protein